MVSFFQQLLGRSAQEPAQALSLGELGVDMHSHLLPGLDDGAETLPQALELLRALQALGYRKLIMTPHIMGDFFRNTPETIGAALTKLRTAAAAAGIRDIELEAAAEYYLDEWFSRRLAAEEPLLTFGGDKRYILLETSYMNESFTFDETIFNLKAVGYQPVLAHPERYTYLHGRFSELERIRANGVLLQVNLNSLAGYYSSAAKHVAEKLIDAGLVDMVGTDTHHIRHTDTLRDKVLPTHYLRKLLALPLLNVNL